MDYEKRLSDSTEKWEDNKSRLSPEHTCSICTAVGYGTPTVGQPWNGNRCTARSTSAADSRPETPNASSS